LRRACDSSIRVRIDSETKEKAKETLGGMGLSISDAVRMFLVRVGSEGRFPFGLEVPNARTKKAMAELEKGGGTSKASVEDALSDLGL